MGVAAVSMFNACCFVAVAVATGHNTTAAPSVVGSEQCQLVRPGETCWAHVQWVMDHLDDYPALSASATFESVQEYLHDTQPDESNCTGLVCSQADLGRQCSTALQKANSSTDCFANVKYAQIEGFPQHPEWYASCNLSSVQLHFESVQRCLHEYHPQQQCLWPCAPPPLHMGSFQMGFWLVYALLTGLPALILLAVGCGCICHLWRRRYVATVQSRYKLLSVYVPLLVSLNAHACFRALSGEANWLSGDYLLLNWQGSESYPYASYAAAAPHIRPLRTLVYIWAAITVSMHLHIPSKRPRGLRGIVSLAALYVGIIAILWFCCWQTGDQGAEATSNFGFLLFSEKRLPAMSLLLCETVRFLDSSDPHGVGALVMVVLALVIIPDFVYNGAQVFHFQSANIGCIVLYFLAATWAMILLWGTSAGVEARLPSFAERYQQVPPFRANFEWFRQFSSSWRGFCWCCAGNAAFSFAFYSVSSGKLKHSLTQRTDDTSYIKYSQGSNLVDGAIACALAALLLAVGNLLVDSMRAHSRWTVFRFIPIDRHFRAIIVTKVLLLWFKVEILAFTTLQQRDQEHSFLQVLQVCTVVGTVLLGIFTPLFGVAAAGNNRNFQELYPKHITLLYSALLAVFTIHLIIGAFVLGKELRSQVADILSRVDTGVVLQLPCSYLMAFLCFENELRWSAAAVRPQDQRTCAEVLSPRGVQALAPLAAIQFTGLVLIDMVSAQYFSPDFLMVLLTGNGRGVYHSGWYPALMTYSTAMLVACGISLWRGVEHPLVADTTPFQDN